MNCISLNVDMQGDVLLFCHLPLISFNRFHPPKITFVAATAFMAGQWSMLHASLIIAESTFTVTLRKHSGAFKSCSVVSNKS